MLNKFMGICGTVTIIIIGFVGLASAGPACYEARGTSTTENITSNLQIGEISLILSGSKGAVFSETGSLVGNITGTSGTGTTLLSHFARFPKGNGFYTINDKTVLAYPYVRDTLEDGTPCSFYIHETIRKIAKGTGFFKKITNVELFADGYISNCPGQNENQFELSGTLCVE